MCRLAQARDVPQAGPPVYLDPEAVVEYTLPSVPLHRPADIYPEEESADDDLTTPDVGGSMPPPLVQ